MSSKISRKINLFSSTINFGLDMLIVGLNITRSKLNPDLFIVSMIAQLTNQSIGTHHEFEMFTDVLSIFARVKTDFKEKIEEWFNKLIPTIE